MMKLISIPIFLLSLLIVGCQTKKPSETTEPTEEKKETAQIDYDYTFMAIEDFNITSESIEVPFYTDVRMDALAVDPQLYPNQFATAIKIFEEDSAYYELSIMTYMEVDGESTYRLMVNGEQVNEIKHPFTEEEGFVTSSFGSYALNTGDTIAVSSNSHSNKLFQNGTEYSFSRGRWTKLFLTKKE